MSSCDFMPIGFVPLANWDIRNRTGSDGHSAEWKTLYDAAKAGKVPAMKLGGSGRWFVHERSAVLFLEEAKRAEKTPREAGKAAKPGASADAIAALTATLSAMATHQPLLVDAVLRIASAVEDIARQGRRQDVNESIGIVESLNGSRCN
jgi:hypothetical protein